MEAYQNYNSVVVNLEPGSNAQTSITKTATYEQAFLGENFSDAKGRARRKKRQLERIAAKREVRTERRKLKGDKQEERIGRRATRKSKRQDIRDEQMKRRRARKEEKDPEEVDETTDETKETRDSEQDGYGDEQDDDIDSSDDTQDDSDSDENSDENSDETGSSEDDIFAGDEESNFVSEITGSSKLPKSIKVICYQIEMTNEALSNLMQVKALKQKQGQSTESIDKDLQTKFNQAQKLESKLEQFSGANGISSNEIKSEKRKARMKRLMNAPVPPVVMDKLMKQGCDKNKIQKWWEQRGRNAAMSKFSFDGTSDEFGLMNEVTEYVDPMEMGVPVYDYDQPETEMVNLDFTEVNSNFSGSSNNFMRSLLIGGVVAFAGIWAIRKYKLLS